MQRIRRAAAVMVAAIMCCFVAAAARAEGVLDQVPSDALVVIKINHLDQTNQKIAKWAEAMGLAQLRPEAANPLGALEEHLGVKEGIDRKGDAAIVILDPTKGRGNAGAKGGARPGARARPKAADDANDAAEAEDENGGGKGEDSVLILVPTSNFKAFASGLPNAKTEGAVTRFHPEEGDENKPGYAAGWGGYAAISPSKALLQNKPQGGLKVTGLAARELKEKDIVVYANLPAIKASLLPKLQQFRQQMKQMQAGGGLGGAPAPGVENEDAGNAPPPPPARPTPRRNPPARRPGARADGAADVVEVLQQGGARQRQAPGRRPPAQPAEADDNKGDDNNGNDAAQPAQNRGGARRPGARGSAAPGPDESMAMMQAMGGMVDQYLAFAERL